MFNKDFKERTDEVNLQVEGLAGSILSPFTNLRNGGGGVRNGSFGEKKVIGPALISFNNKTTIYYYYSCYYLVNIRQTLC